MALLLGGLLALTASLPPEHGHTDPLGRTTVVHRHASLHVVRASSHLALSGTEALVIRIDAAYLASAPPSADRMVAPLAARAAADTPTRAALRVLLDNNAVGIHGPPLRPSAPRPPPVSAVV